MIVNWRHFGAAFFLSFLLSVTVFMLLGIAPQKALFGFFYFLVTPFLAIPVFPVSIVVIIILLLLFRRVGSCMRPNLQWIAYLLLFLHWVAWGFYCSSYVSL